MFPTDVTANHHLAKMGRGIFSISSTLKLQKSFLNSPFSQKVKQNVHVKATGLLKGKQHSGVVVRDAILKDHKSLPVPAKLPVLGKS